MLHAIGVRTGETLRTCLQEAAARSVAVDGAICFVQTEDAEQNAFSVESMQPIQDYSGAALGGAFGVSTSGPASSSAHCY